MVVLLVICPELAKFSDFFHKNNYPDFTDLGESTLYWNWS